MKPVNTNRLHINVHLSANNNNNMNTVYLASAENQYLQVVTVSKLNYLVIDSLNLSSLPL